MESNVITHKPGQYFIVAGDTVYASLMPTLKQNHFVFFTNGGLDALNPKLAERTQEIPFLFDFLNKMMQTPVVHSDVSSIKEKMMEDIYDYFTEFRDYFSRVTLGQFRKNLSKEYANDRTKTLFFAFFDKKADIIVPYQGTQYTIKMAIQTLTSVPIISPFGEANTDMNVELILPGKHRFRFHHTKLYEVHKIVGEHFWSVIRKKHVDTSLEIS